MLSGEWSLPKTLQWKQAGLDEDHYERKVEEILEGVIEERRKCDE
jgi:hypothetical protein